MPHRLADAAVKLGATTLVLILGTAGLGVAGVHLPERAQQAFEGAGISLPNQASGDSGQASDNAKSDDVKSVIEATPTAERGCEFGRRVAEAAKGSALPEQARTACEHGQDHAKPGSEQSASAGREFGQETAERARGLGDATVEQRGRFRKDTAEAKQLGWDQI